MQNMFLGMPHQSIIDWLNGQPWPSPTPPEPVWTPGKLIPIKFLNENGVEDNEVSQDDLRIVCDALFGFEIQFQSNWGDMSPEFIEEYESYGMTVPGWNIYGADYKTISTDPQAGRTQDIYYTLNSQLLSYVGELPASIEKYRNQADQEYRIVYRQVNDTTHENMFYVNYSTPPHGEYSTAAPYGQPIYWKDLYNDGQMNYVGETWFNYGSTIYVYDESITGFDSSFLIVDSNSNVIPYVYNGRTSDNQYAIFTINATGNVYLVVA